MAISPDDLFGNMMRATFVEEKRNRVKLGQSIDRAEWFMNPPTVNANDNSLANEIAFPVAILQPPFFNLKADVAVIERDFDDSGSQYDGKLSNWWTDNDRKKFDVRAGKLIAQYNGFKILGDVSVNDEFTQGENVGDLSGFTHCLQRASANQKWPRSTYY